MSKGKIVIISGPSGSGKTTLHKKLLLSPRLKRVLVKSISATTRERRSGEKHGRDYLFFSLQQFLSHRKNGYFLEWQKVFDQYYGTPHQKVEELLRKGKNVLLCIDVKGAKVVFKKHPDAVKIFITVPSFAILKERLRRRATESKQHLRLRLAAARKELKEAKHYDFIVINDRLSAAARKLESMVVNELGLAHRRSRAKRKD